MQFVGGCWNRRPHHPPFRLQGIFYIFVAIAVLHFLLTHLMIDVSILVISTNCVPSFKVVELWEMAFAR